MKIYTNDLVKGHSDFKVKCLTFGLYTQVSDSGPLGPLVLILLIIIVLSLTLSSQFKIPLKTSVICTRYEGITDNLVILFHIDCINISCDPSLVMPHSQ